MNINAQALVFAVLALASAALIGSGLTDRSPPATEIVKLERLVVHGKRAAAPPVSASLPRVVIVGRSVAQTDERLASAQPTGQAF